MVRPERRTRGDLAAAAAIAVAVAVGATLIWWHSDARATQSQPATAPAADAAAARQVPTTLTQRWSAASPATSRPIVVSGTLVTGAGAQMTGRDPATGESRWSYTRDVDLCAVTYVYHYALAVYPDDRGCGQISAVDAGTGMRGPARSSYSDRHVNVTSNGSAVLSAGPTRLEMWRSDLVRMLSYGEIDAPIKPSLHPLGTGCALLSAAAGSSAVSVLEACPDEPEVRLTLLRPGKEEDEPEVRYVTQRGITADSGARVLAVSDSRTLVYLPIPQPRIEVVDESGDTVSSTLLTAPASAAAAVSGGGDVVTWWTGHDVMVLGSADLTYRFTIDATEHPVGPATMMAGRLLVPVTGGLGIYAAASGERERVIPVARPASAAAVLPAVSGAVIIEQRGDTVVGLS